jgi:NTP pyrophosphatase (non-canonical NTP hydrolase)
MTPLYVDQVWRLATQEAGRRGRPVLYVFAELLGEDVRRQARDELRAETREALRDVLPAVLALAIALPPETRAALERVVEGGR